MIDAWKKPDNDPNFIRNICADFDHRRHGNEKSGYYRAGYEDLDILINAWQAREGSGGPFEPLADCLE